MKGYCSLCDKPVIRCLCPSKRKMERTAPGIDTAILEAHNMGAINAHAARAIGVQNEHTVKHSMQRLFCDERTVYPLPVILLF